MIRRLWSWLLPAALVASCILLAWYAHGHGPSTPMARGGAVVNPPLPNAAPVSIDAGSMDDGLRDAIAANLRSDENLVRDVTFLVASEVQVRCDPAHAHDLPRMAVQAHLPMLRGVQALMEKRPDMQSYFHSLLQRISTGAPCGRMLDIAVGSFRMPLDPSVYSAAFPDSYFDPALQAVPGEFAGRDLHVRGKDPCTPIGYAVLPLDAERPWQCGSLRAALRRRVITQTCPDVLRSLPTSPTAATPAAQQQMARAIRSGLDALPAMCR